MSTSVCEYHPVIAFGVAVNNERLYRRAADPTIAALAEPDSLVIAKRGYGSITEPYNEILGEAGARDDLEAVVLLHQDAEITESGFLERVRYRLLDPRVGLVGGWGARRCGPSAHWWAGEVIGRTSFPAYSPTECWPTQGPHYADVADGYLLVVSAAVARKVRFDSQLSEAFHGYDVDFSFRVRARGYRVVIEEFSNIHHSVGAVPNDPRWPAGADIIRQTWSPMFWPAAWRGSAPLGFFADT
jgi:GT2 family glycosyltransferase